MNNKIITHLRRSKVKISKCGNLYFIIKSNDLWHWMMILIFLGTSSWWFVNSSRRFGRSCCRHVIIYPSSVFLNLRRWRWFVSVTLQSLCCPESGPRHPDWRPGWAPETVRERWWCKIVSTPAGKWTTGFQSSSNKRNQQGEISVLFNEFVDEWKRSKGNRYNDSGTGIRKFLEKNLPRFQFVQHKTCMTWPLIESRLLRWEIGD